MRKQKEKTYVANPKIIFRNEGNDALLFNTQNGNTSIINSTGMFIWRMCNGKHSKPAIIKKAAGEFRGKPDDIACDVSRFISTMVESGMIIEK